MAWRMKAVDRQKNGDLKRSISGEIASCVLSRGNISPNAAIAGAASRALTAITVRYGRRAALYRALASHSFARAALRQINVNRRGNAGIKAAACWHRLI